MQSESDAPVCIICGTPATRAFGSSGAIPLCPLFACEQRLTDDLNLTIDLHVAISRASNEGAQP